MFSEASESIKACAKGMAVVVTARACIRAARRATVLCTWPSPRTMTDRVAIVYWFCTTFCLPSTTNATTVNGLSVTVRNMPLVLQHTNTRLVLTQGLPKIRSSAASASDQAGDCARSHWSQRCCSSATNVGPCPRCAGFRARFSRVTYCCNCLLSH
eukprot:8589849-Lingulodinium_polyedra.AAC.1